MVVLDAEMAETFPRRKVHTAHNLPRLAVSSSAPHLQAVRVRTMSVEMNLRHRSSTAVQPLGGIGAFHLDTPQTSRPLDLRLPRLGGSKSLSSLVVHANHRLRDQQLQLQRIDPSLRSGQLAPISRPTTSHEAGGSDALATEHLMDGIGHLFAQSAAVYARGKKPLPGAADAAMLELAREQEAAEKEKQELHRLELKRQVAANNASKSLVRAEILEKLEELRSDPEAADKFETYIETIRRAGPAQGKVKEHIRTMSKASPAEFAQEMLAQKTARRDELGQRRIKAKLDFEENREARFRKLMNKMNAKHASHEAGMHQQMLMGAAQAALMPSLAWLTLAQVHKGATVMGAALRAGRETCEQRKLALGAVAVLQRQFRLMSLRKRFHNLRRTLNTLRRLVWYWRFKRRIKIKTAAYLAYLTLTPTLTPNPNPKP